MGWPVGLVDGWPEGFEVGFEEGCDEGEVVGQQVGTFVGAQWQTENCEQSSKTFCSCKYCKSVFMRRKRE